MLISMCQYTNGKTAKQLSPPTKRFASYTYGRESYLKEPEKRRARNRKSYMKDPEKSRADSAAQSHES